MAWLFFALLANFLYSVNNVTDQFIRRKRIKHDASFIVIWMSFFFLLWLMVIPFIEITMPPLPQLLAALVSGFILLFMVWVYVYAISSQEVSKVIPLFSFQAVFVLIFSTIFLNEALAPVKYAGFTLMFLAGLIIIAERIEGSFKLNRSLLMVVGASVILAASIMLLKFFYLTETFWNGFFWFNIGGFMSVIVIALLPDTRKNLGGSVRSLNLKLIGLLLIAVVTAFFGDLSALFAIKSGPVSLVSVVGSTQIAFLFVMTLMLSRFFPKILKERADKKTLLTKTTAIALMVIGLFLLNRGV